MTVPTPPSTPSPKAGNPIAAPTPNDDVMPKQERVEWLIDQRAAATNASIATKANRGTTAVPATTAPGAAYVQTEAASVRAAVESIRAALIASGVIAS